MSNTPSRKYRVKCYPTNREHYWLVLRAIDAAKIPVEPSSLKVRAYTEGGCICLMPEGYWEGYGRNGRSEKYRRISVAAFLQNLRRPATGIGGAPKAVRRTGAKRSTAKPGDAKRRSPK